MDRASHRRTVLRLVSTGTTAVTDPSHYNQDYLCTEGTGQAMRHLMQGKPLVAGSFDPSADGMPAHALTAVDHLDVDIVLRRSRFDLHVSKHTTKRAREPAMFGRKHITSDGLQHSPHLPPRAACCALSRPRRTTERQRFANDRASCTQGEFYDETLDPGCSGHIPFSPSDHEYELTYLGW